MKGQKGGKAGHSSSGDHDMAVFGHELGNVLNGMLGMAELLRDSGLTGEQRQWLDAIEESGRQLRRLIESIHRTPRGSATLAQPRTVRTDGIAMLEHIMISHAPAALRRNNLLAMVTEPGLPRYWTCDPCLVRQLLDNLMSNAIKFSRSAEVVLEASLVPAIPTRPAALGLRVQDTGPGIDPAAGTRIFEAYQKYGVREPGRAGGAGLGLFICRDIVRSMNGRIDWSTPREGGACFEVLLPGLPLTETAVAMSGRTFLLSDIRCLLDLGVTLRRSVGGFLNRLGVPWEAGQEDSRSLESLPGVGEHDSVDAAVLAVRVTAVPGPGERGQPQCLSLRPLTTTTGLRLQSRTLGIPVLESTLAAVLLEIGLEWRRELLV